MIISQAREIKKEKQAYSLEEYFELEEIAVYKSEFRNGKIIPMAGGTLAHSRLISNILKLLGQLEGDEFEALSSDQKVFIPAYNHNVYTDGLVIIGEPEMYNNGNQAILNPTLVVEVLSDSTERYDRGEKFRKYQTLPSFQEYVLVDQKMPVVDVLYKEGERDWRIKTYIGLDDEIVLKTINVKIKMTDIYKKVQDLKNPQASFSFPLK